MHSRSSGLSPASRRTTSLPWLRIRKAGIASVGSSPTGQAHSSRWFTPTESVVYPTA